MCSCLVGEWQKPQVRAHFSRFLCPRGLEAHFEHLRLFFFLMHLLRGSASAHGRLPGVEQCTMSFPHPPFHING